MPMPWWAIFYLVILSIVIIISIIKDRIDNKSFLYQSGELLSGLAGILFIYSYWNIELIALASWLSVPLLLYAISWDQYALNHIRKSNYPDLTEDENRDMDRYSKIFAILFILPCYIAGILLIYKLYN
ncbi:MAG: hypothetical protein OQK72_06120 [Gammaproteobacteria bacterium]|nr:hypothetical protein [Gammaproteobacteria bacterium]MCW9005269.1 hypothetical protein [Gammaproteobacteria bacterium]MCW9057235.1 hypothetical protein [Gammaproteobacteria bacterium]